MRSLDPRVNRLPKMGQPGEVQPKAKLDQFGTYEVFVQPRAGRSFQHEGIVHAPNIEMAFVLAKEAFTRRFTCTSLYVADTRNVYVSLLTDDNRNAYDLVSENVKSGGLAESYEIYHLIKRGKQHLHAGTVHATSPEEAMAVAKKEFGDTTVLNIWALRTSDIRFTTEEEQDLWMTLPEKKFRDASDYKGGDKLKDFLDRNKK